jgi:hypothetical protein
LSTALPVILNALGLSTIRRHKAFRLGSAPHRAPATSNLRLPKSRASSLHVCDGPQDWTHMAQKTIQNRAKYTASIGPATCFRPHSPILEFSRTATIPISAAGSVVAL